MKIVVNADEWYRLMTSRTLGERAYLWTHATNDEAALTAAMAPWLLREASLYLQEGGNGGVRGPVEMSMAVDHGVSDRLPVLPPERPEVTDSEEKSRALARVQRERALALRVARRLIGVQLIAMAWTDTDGVVVEVMTDDGAVRKRMAGLSVDAVNYMVHSCTADIERFLDDLTRKQLGYPIL